MRALHALFAAFVALATPSLCLAGPIEFQLIPTSLWTPPGSQGISKGLVLISPLTPDYTFDPAGGAPSAVTVVGYDGSLVPPPPCKPSGVSHWNNAGPFKVTLHLTDAASGESADVELKGHIHMVHNPQKAKPRWDGDIEFRFLDDAQVTLGDYTYFLWGINNRDEGPATVHVRVEPNSPGPDAPEPGTLLLAGLGIAPIVLRRLWRT
jgi:hypothetical protein